jgi:hypothetical protein
VKVEGEGERSWRKRGEKRIKKLKIKRCDSEFSYESLH